MAKRYIYSNVTRLLFSLFLISGTSANAQKLPDEINLSSDKKKLITGNSPYSGFYDQFSIVDMQLEFSQSGYWNTLGSNYSNQINMLAKLTVNGVVYDSVGVRFKGSTSYSGSNDFKKSFNITLDEYIPDQNIFGYNIINLNNAYHDPSFMREILYEYLIGKHCTAPKGNFAHLTINGSDWGIYANVQQVNRDLTRQWFPNSGGSLWRAKRPEGSPAPGGSRGDSLRSLHYLGPDTTAYMIHYNLKSGGLVNPHTRLRDFTYILDTVSNTYMEDVLADHLDIDNTLWLMIGENMFADDDSYVIKGRSDYYFYIDSITGRMTLIEMDGNDVFIPSTYNYSIFGNVSSPYYPLLYKLVNHPQLRQRYLAHYRTFVDYALDTSIVFPLINTFHGMIDTFVSVDPVNNYTYAEFLDDKDILKDYVVDRKNYVLGRAEIDVESPVISNTVFYSDSLAWEAPMANQDVIVNTTASHSSGINKATLYYSTGLTGKFMKTLMFDDGLHHDSAAGDGIFGGIIPGMSGVTRVRFYVEATADNTPKTVKYDPVGAEHEVYTYLVKPALAADTSVVINEVMAKNVSTVQDSLGNYSDWIELYNNSSVDKDISGYYLSDNPDNLIKWQIPQGTIIQANDYLILWADDHNSNGPFHTNFKLSGDGDELFFLNSNMELINHLAFGVQTADMGYARVPNGTGSFYIQTPTFALNNNIYPQISFGSDINSGCGPLTVNFSNNTTNAISYSWDFGDGNTSTHPSPSHTYTSSGTYTVTLTAGTGLLTSSDSVVSMISVQYAAPFSFASDSIITVNPTVLLNADPGYADYSWSNGLNGQSIVVDSSGLYCVTFTDFNTCYDSACVFVLLNAVGLGNEISNSGIRIYPNPAGDYLIVQSSKSDFEIVNSLGQSMYKSTGSDKHILKTSEWPSGLYLLKTDSDLMQFIIQH
jgi:hypothetical protein